MNPLLALWRTSVALSRHPLMRCSVPGAACELIRSRLVLGWLPPGSDVGVEYPNGTRLHLPARMKGAIHFVTLGLCEFAEMAFVTHCLRGEDLFVDAGANVGAYTVLAGGVAGARTLSFEPHPDSFRCLQRNIAVNALGSLAVAKQTALGRASGRVRLTDADGMENRVLSSPSAGAGIEVPILPLDEALAGQPVPAVIKMDVEGFESEVLAGAQHTLQQPGLLGMIIERGGSGQEYGFDEAALHRSLHADGWSPWRYDPFQRTLTHQEADAIGNLIYLRDPERVAARLRSAPCFQYRSFSI
jgi:FkbM family methyltransferase